MNSEKVKEIKKALECCRHSIKDGCKDCPYHNPNEDCQEFLIWNMEDYINELESENERLNKSDTSKEESSIEYYNLYKDLKRKNKDLNELCELQRVSIAESFVRENQLKDRIAELESELEKEQINNLNCDTELQYKEKQIAELEKETKIKTDTITDLLKKQEFYETEKLKQFAERLKEKIKNFCGTEYENAYYDVTKKFACDNVDVTLNKFINKGE